MLLSVFSLLSAQDNRIVDSTLQEIETLYNSAQYNSAELYARRLLEEKILSDSVKTQIHKWIAFSLIAQGKLTSARERFIEVFSINPDFDLDPILTSPKILAVFNDAKLKYLTNKTVKKDTSTITIVSTYHISYRTILFPGWEQLYHGRNTLGGILLGAGVASLGAGITFEVLRARSRDEYLRAIVPSEISSKYSSYNSYRKAEIYSFFTFALVYAMSEIEVFSNSENSTFSFKTDSTGFSGASLTFSLHF